jgi:hypothetical protein
MPGAEPELIYVSADNSQSWEKLVRTSGRERCANCGGTDRLRPRMIVPLEAGGQLVESNGALLCRTCELALESAASTNTSSQAKRPVNFWVSRALYDRLSVESERTLFRSMAGLTRFLLTKYVEDPERFDDLEQYQDEGADVKVNVWIESSIYERFKQLVDLRGSTVTQTLKALIQLFETDAHKLNEVVAPADTIGSALI